MSLGQMQHPKYGGVCSSNLHNMYGHKSLSPMNFDDTVPFVDHVGLMTYDAMIANEVNTREQPNAQAQAFYDILEAV